MSKDIELFVHYEDTGNGQMVIRSGKLTVLNESGSNIVNEWCGTEYMPGETVMLNASKTSDAIGYLKSIGASYKLSTDL